MDVQKLIEFWKKEEATATVKGWDFSHLKGRWDDDEKTLPWNYRETILKYIKPEMKILDIDTGGGEFVTSLNHPPKNISVTEDYAPNFALCEKVLSPMGITVKKAPAHALPFEDASFDVVLNRHGSLDPCEAFRVLKDGGYFITEQVGAYNDREFVKLLLPKMGIPFPDQYLQTKTAEFENAGFDIVEENEAYHPIRFYDVGALVWFAKVVEWEFPDFTVEGSLDRLLEAQELIETEECIEGEAHRFFFIAKK